MDTVITHKKEQDYTAESEDILDILSGNKKTSGDDCSFGEYDEDDLASGDKEVFLRNNEISCTRETILHYTNQNVRFIDSEHTSQLVDRYQKEPDREKKDRLLNEIVFMNAGLVTSIARKYSGLPGTTLEDIIQSGMLGLIKAINRYDYSKGFAFSTYAVHWIRQAITREYGNTCDLIRKPIHFLAVEGKYKYFVSKYMQEHGGDFPDDKVISEATDIPLDRIKEIRLHSYHITSYDAPVSGDDSSKDDDMQLLDILAGDGSIDSGYMQTELAEAINNELMAKLSDKERHVIAERFGLNGRRPKTLEEVGNELGVTRERIRQIESKAIGKMRARARKKHLTYEMLHVDN